METNTASTRTHAQETGSSSSSSASQLREGFTAALTSADAMAAQSIQTLQQVHQARLSLLQRTAANLKAQYGADDSRVKAAQAAVAATTGTISRIGIVSQQLNTMAPQVAADGWALHGRVFDAQGKPLARYTVFLVDSQHTYQEAYGFAYTDETGYFLLNVASAAAKAGSHAVAAATSLFVEVANTKGQPVYLSTTAFVPVVGSATYQTITVPAGSQPIGDPPEAIRKVAIPSRKKKQQSAKAKRGKS
jgi:hypothetical protein